MPMAEDLTPFFAESDFATQATLGGTAVLGIFTDPYAIGSVGGVGMATGKPTFAMASSDVPADPVDMALVLGGVSYIVADAQPDGTGVTTLVLEVS